MNERAHLDPPAALRRIGEESEASGFGLASDPLMGSLLRTLAAAKPGGQFLEIGTGTGLATAWILDGMDRESRLVTVDQDASVVSIARKYLGEDPRVTFSIADAGPWLESRSGPQFDLIFADAWPGKYSHLNEALGLLKAGGLYVIDDMLPQANWPEGHGMRVERLIAELERRGELQLTKMNWSSGIVVAAKVD